MNVPAKNLFGDEIEARRSAAKKRVAGLKLSEPLPAPRFRVLNLGGGVQSCALALMSARGELEPLDFAIFADTGWEKARTYRYLDWLETRVPFPIMRVRREGPDLGTYLIEGATLPQAGRQHAPFYLLDEDGRLGMMPKQCSKEFKTRVIHAALREILGLEYGERGPAEPVIEQWLGMTIDELSRISTSEKRYLHHRYPLIELRMTKMDLYPWYELRQLPLPPKSSCIFCPLQKPAQFADVMADPGDSARLVPFDQAIRPGYLGMRGGAYLTRRCQPIGVLDLTTAEERGQIAFIDEAGNWWPEEKGPIGFGDFCGDGVCGV